jgi:hypothetical protein
MFMRKQGDLIYLAEISKRGKYRWSILARRSSQGVADRAVEATEVPVRIRKAIYRQKHLAALAALVLATGTALAAPPMVLHNGSLMQIIEGPPRTIRIVYVQPRPEMASIGVMPGTLLVDGTWTGPNTFAGTARVFSTQCGALPYRVEGGVAPDGSLELGGFTPIIGWDCQLLSWEWTTNSRLRFTQVGAR